MFPSLSPSLGFGGAGQPSPAGEGESIVLQKQKDAPNNLDASFFILFFNSSNIRTKTFYFFVTSN
jgi:hypothetical protein